MGQEYGLRCTRCRRRVTARAGLGRGPLIYANYLYKGIMTRKSEDKLRKELKEHPGCLPDPTWNIYVCDGCRFWMSDQSKNIVRFYEKVLPPEDGMEEFRYMDFELVKRIYKKCPLCDKRMHKLKCKMGYLNRETVMAMRCPYCGSRTKIAIERYWD